MIIVTDLVDFAGDRIASISLKAWAGIVAVLLAIVAVYCAAQFAVSAFEVGRAMDRAVATQTADAFAVAR